MVIFLAVFRQLHGMHTVYKQCSFTCRTSAIDFIVETFLSLGLMNQNIYYHVALDESSKIIAVLTHQIPIFGTIIIVITLHVSQFVFEGCLRFVTKYICYVSLF